MILALSNVFVRVFLYLKNLFYDCIAIASLIYSNTKDTLMLLS